MKAVLEFVLPDDEYDHRLAIHAGQMHADIWNLDQELRGYLKHGVPEDDTFKTPQAVMQYVRDHFRDIINSTEG